MYLQRLKRKLTLEFKLTRFIQIEI